MKQEEQKKEVLLNDIVQNLTELTLLCDAENAAEIMDGILAEFEFRMPNLKNIIIKNEKKYWQNFRETKRNYCIELRRVNNCFDCAGCGC